MKSEIYYEPREELWVARVTCYHGPELADAKVQCSLQLAAPDLLAACVRAAEFVREVTGTASSEYRTVIAAIQKARGEQP